MTAPSRPPGDRNVESEVRDLLVELRKQLDQLKTQHTHLLKIETSWWDQLPEHPVWDSVMLGTHQPMFLASRSTSPRVVLKCDAMDDGLQLTIYDMQSGTVFWQRKLFYRRSSR